MNDEPLPSWIADATCLFRISSTFPIDSLPIPDFPSQFQDGQYSGLEILLRTMSLGKPIEA